MSESRRFYEGLWKGGWRTELEAPGASYRTRLRLLLACVARLPLDRDARVLDVGCGNGRLLAELAARLPGKPRLAGVDVSQAALDAARERLPETDLRLCDLDAEELPEFEPCDLVVSSEVLEHVENPARALDWMARTLKRGGFLVVSVPGGARFWGPHDEAVGHRRRYEEAEMRATLKAAGLDVLHCFTWGALLYRLYYAMVLNRVDPQAAWKRKGALSRALHGALYRLFFLDDLLTVFGGGRMLFAAARKPASEKKGGFSPVARI